MVKAPQGPKVIGVLPGLPQDSRFAVAVGPAVIRRSEAAIPNGDLDATKRYHPPDDRGPANQMGGHRRQKIQHFHTEVLDVLSAVC